MDDSFAIRLGLFISMPILGAILIALGVVWWKKRGAEAFHMLLAKRNDPTAAAGLTTAPTAGEMAVEMGAPSSAQGSPDPSTHGGTTDGAGVTSSGVSLATALDTGDTTTGGDTGDKKERAKKRDTSSISAPADERQDYMW